MPNRIAAGCSWPGGCAAKAVRGGRCAQHARQDQRQYNERRGSAASRGYGHRWSMYVRPMVLRRDPLCYDPFGIECTQASSDAEHVIPRAAGGTDTVGVNLRGCCEACHSRKTLLEQTVRFASLCSCEVHTHCVIEAGSRIIRTVCESHAPVSAKPIKLWSQIISNQ